MSDTVATCYFAGYSADAVTSYISALARKAPNVNSLVNDLQAQVRNQLAEAVNPMCILFSLLQTFTSPHVVQHALRLLEVACSLSTCVTLHQRQ